jgi:hypothetical protein
MIQRPEVAAWVAQCIANWSWVESVTGNLFVNLLGTNLTAGAALYNDMTSALAKDRALRSVALAAVSPTEYTLFEALLKVKASLQTTRDRLAHWYWGVCNELPDGLVLVDPRYLAGFRADLLERRDKGDLSGAQIDKSKIYAVRVKDLQADAAQFADFAQLMFKFANLVAEKRPSRREQLHRELSSDARIREVLDRGNRSDQKKTPPALP